MPKKEVVRIQRFLDEEAPQTANGGSSKDESRTTSINVLSDTALVKLLKGGVDWKKDSEQLSIPANILSRIGDAKLKTLLRTTQARTLETLWSAIGSLLDKFAPDECERYIRHCGYCHSG